MLSREMVRQGVGSWCTVFLSLVPSWFSSFWECLGVTDVEVHAGHCQMAINKIPVIYILYLVCILVSMLLFLPWGLVNEVDRLL